MYVIPPLVVLVKKLAFFNKQFQGFIMSLMDKRIP